MSAERYEGGDPHGRFRYGPWRGGRDPLAPPYDLRAALDKIGEDVLSAGTVRDALRELMQRGLDGRGGLDKLAQRLRKLRAAARKRGDLGGTLDQIRAALDQALAAEREQLAGMDGDEHRLAEMELETIPDDVAGAVRALSDYQWRSDEARQTYQAITQMLQREVLDAQFAGMKQALEGQDPEAMQQVKDMLADLNNAAGQARPQRGHHRRVRRVHGQARRVLPRAAGDRRGADRRAGPPAGRRSADDELAQPRAARAAGPADAAGAVRRRPGLGDGSAVGQPARAPSRTGPVLADRDGTGWPTPRLRRGGRGGGRARRPGGAQPAAVPEQPGVDPRRRRRRPAGEAARPRRRGRPAGAARPGARARAPGLPDPHRRGTQADPAVAPPPRPDRPQAGVRPARGVRSRGPRRPPYGFGRRAHRV